MARIGRRLLSLTFPFRGSGGRLVAVEGNLANGGGDRSRAGRRGKRVCAVKPWRGWAIGRIPRVCEGFFPRDFLAAFFRRQPAVEVDCPVSLPAGVGGYLCGDGGGYLAGVSGVSGAAVRRAGAEVAEAGIRRGAWGGVRGGGGGWPGCGRFSGRWLGDRRKHCHSGCGEREVRREGRGGCPGGARAGGRRRRCR